MSRRSFLNFLPKTGSEERTETVAAVPDAAEMVSSFEQSGRGWFWATDANGGLTYLSDSICQLVGHSPETIAGSPLTGLFLPTDDNRDVRQRLPFVLGRKSPFDRLVLQTRTGEDARWWEVSGRPIIDELGEFQGYRGFSVDVTEQLQSSRSASQLALFDPLTGLPNRLNMSRTLERCIHSVEHHGKVCTVMMIDLDRFKQVNDSLGHPAGDALLKSVAARLVKVVGDSSKVFRLGGDEFQLILPDTEDRGFLGQLADRIIESVSQPYMIDGSRCVIGASIGIGMAPFDATSSENLVRNADLALYSAKANGRGCYRFFSTSLLEVAEDRRILENDLRDAITNGDLSLYYQPQVSVDTNSVTGVEALIRWEHPVRGMISPALFIPIAEEANLIEKLGEWIIRKACDDAAAWPGAIKVAVNVSPLQFSSDNLPATIVSALAHSGLPAGRLELELTEGVFLSESIETDAMFSALKDIGVRLALDDFGTGYSSLGYLKTAPFDKIKIDQSFVRGATLPGSRNGAIIAAIVALAGALDMETTAEGIETLDQLELICSLGVSHIQGYVYSKPITARELGSQLADGQWTLAPTGPARQRSERKSMYRKAGAIVGNYYHPVIIRNLSETGALLEGLIDIPVGTQIVLDFGECQMEIATVRRITKRGHGISFGHPLVGDGAGNLGTSHRISPYILSKMGLSASDHLGASRVWDSTNSVSIDMLAAALGLTMPEQNAIPASGDFGTAQTTGFAPLPANANPLHSLMLLGASRGGERQLTQEEWERLKTAVEASQNSQLRYIIALVVLTGARLHELMGTHWSDINFETGIWTVKASRASPQRQITLSKAALEVIDQLPRWPECANLIVNPRTRKPYNSVFGSWDAARRRAGLDHLSIHELRNSLRRTW